MTKEMLINVSEGEETRIALLEDGRLEELYMERSSSTSHVGNIYKGRVTNVEASIQAAFVDFGLGRNGFLHISDLMPTYFGRRGEEIVETVGKKMARRDRPPIQRCLRRGDEIIVQIIKEGIGTKGPTLSTYLSIPGRILVMMPGLEKMGVSRKIEDDEERRRLRGILDSVKPPEGVGFIIRTAGIGKSKTEIQRDLTYLTRLWQTIEKTRQSSPAPVELYTEGDLVTRTVRDVFGADVDRIVVDNKDVAKRVKDVIKLANPRTKNRVELYEDPLPLFHKFNIERDIELMHSRHVPLPSGGSLVIDSTEAVVAIDVNSGKSRESSDAETTAFKTDMEAADEIPRQLRLRDLGGVIICDFIDLRYERHRRELEARLNDHFKHDRAKTKVLRMSQFGIIEMTRQRMRPSLKRSIYFDCPHCKGAGLVKTPESMSLDVMRRLAIALDDQRVVRVELTIGPDAALYLQNRKRRQLADLEDAAEKHVLVRSDVALGLDEMRLALFDARDGLVVIDQLASVSSTAQPTSAPVRRGQQPQNRNAGRSDDRRGGSDRGPRGEQQRSAPNQRRGGGAQPFDADEDERRYDEEPDSGFVDLDDGHEPLGEAPQPIDSEDDDSARSDVDMGDNTGDNDSDRRRGNPGAGRVDRRPPQPANRMPRRDDRAAASADDRGDVRGARDGDDRHLEPRLEDVPNAPVAGSTATTPGRESNEQGEDMPRRRRRRRRGRRGRGGSRNDFQNQPDGELPAAEHTAEASPAGSLDEREQHPGAVERAIEDEDAISTEAQRFASQSDEESNDFAAHPKVREAQPIHPPAAEPAPGASGAASDQRASADDEPFGEGEPEDNFGNSIDYVQPHERPRSDRGNRGGRSNRSGPNPRQHTNPMPPRQGARPPRDNSNAGGPNTRGGGGDRQPRRDGGSGSQRNDRNQNRNQSNRDISGPGIRNQRDNEQRPNAGRPDARNQRAPDEPRRDNRGPAGPRATENAPASQDARSGRAASRRGNDNRRENDEDPRLEAGADHYDEQRTFADEGVDGFDEASDGPNRSADAVDSHAVLPPQSSGDDAPGVVEDGAGELSADEEAAPRRRRRRGGRGRRTKASGQDDAAGASPSEIAADKPASPAAAKDAVLPARVEVSIPQPPVTRTGSTDRHLMSDEPIMPEPVRRPRSYRDLDEIPDDLD